MPRQKSSAAAVDAGGAKVDRDKILEVAERIAAVEGASALSMRRLGDELGINHTAIYRHYRDKAELLTAVADRVLERRAVPLPDGDWRDALRVQLRHGFGRYDVHPELAQVIALLPITSEVLAAQMERALAVFESIGLSVEDAADLYELSEAFVVGFGLYASLLKDAQARGETLDNDAERRMLATLPPERYPHVAAAAANLFHEPSAVFERAVELLLDAAERRART